MAIKTGIIDPDLALEMVRTSPVIAYDTETSGLEFKDYICGYVFTDWAHSVYVPVRHEGGGNIPYADEFEEELRHAFADRSRFGYRVVGHHLGFDLRKSLKHGIRLWHPLEDTMINEGLIDDRTIGYGLDDLSKRWGVTVKLGDELYRELAQRFGGIPDRKQMANYYKLAGDNEKAVDYATGDGVSTLEVWEKQQPVLDSEDLRKPWALECALLPYLARMHHRGVKIDPDYSATVMDDVAKAIENAKQQFTPGFNVRSPTDVEKLYRSHGYRDEDFQYTDPTEKKPSGQVSFTEKWLNTNDIGRAIVAVRQLEKARDSFITPLIDTHNHDGRVHAILNQSKSDEYGVAGARLSCSTPNLQAFPKRNFNVGRVVRRLVIADHDWLFEEGDFKQQEPRFFTHYSEEPSLIEGYRNGTYDIHDRASEVLSLHRDVAKRLGLGMLTMMSPKTLAMHMSWPLSAAKEAHRAFLTDAFPKIGEFQQTAVRVFKNRGYVKSILGRRARLETPRWAYKAVSRIIQNSGGDHMKTALLRACQYEDAYSQYVNILLSIHDSTIWQRDPGHDVSELRRVIENVVHEPDFNLIVPIPIDLGSGRDWARASYGAKLDKVAA